MKKKVQKMIWICLSSLLASSVVFAQVEKLPKPRIGNASLSGVETQGFSHKMYSGTFVRKERYDTETGQLKGSLRKEGMGGEATYNRESRTWFFEFGCKCDFTTSGCGYRLYLRAEGNRLVGIRNGGIDGRETELTRNADDSITGTIVIIQNFQKEIWSGVDLFPEIAR